jgi:hypothetical protein
MKYCFRLLWYLCFWIPSATAQTNNSALTVGGRVAGMSGAGVNLTDVWSVTNNIAGITHLKKPALGVYTQNRFNLKALSTVTLQGVYPLVKAGALGLELSRFGDKLYNEQQIGVGFAHQIGPVSLGLKATIWQVHLEELGSKRTLTFAFGGQSEIIPDLLVGAHIFNLNQAKLAEYQDERLPTVMTAGVTYKASPKLLLSVQTDKNLEMPADFKTGLEYFVIEKLALRTGFSTATQSVTGGIGFKSSAFQVDYALGSHSVLGFSNHVAVSYQFE